MTTLIHTHLGKSKRDNTASIALFVTGLDDIGEASRLVPDLEGIISDAIEELTGKRPQLAPANA